MRSTPVLSAVYPPLCSLVSATLHSLFAGEDWRGGAVSFIAGRGACIAFVSVGYNQLTFHERGVSGVLD